MCSLQSWWCLSDVKTSRAVIAPWEQQQSAWPVSYLWSHSPPEACTHWSRPHGQCQHTPYFTTVSRGRTRCSRSILSVFCRAVSTLSTSPIVLNVMTTFSLAGLSVLTAFPSHGQATRCVASPHAAQTAQHWLLPTVLPLMTVEDIIQR